MKKKKRFLILYSLKYSNTFPGKTLSLSLQYIFSVKASRAFGILQFLGFHIVLFRSIACDFVVREYQLLVIGVKKREDLRAQR